jgi:hypothetical protein
MPASCSVSGCSVCCVYVYGRVSMSVFLVCECAYVCARVFVCEESLLLLWRCVGSSVYVFLSTEWTHTHVQIHTKYIRVAHRFLGYSSEDVHA